MARRLGIFCMYDREGIVDDYVVYLLQEMQKILAHLAVIVNGNLTPEGKSRLEQITKDIFVRENVGFDFEAWRQGILRHESELKSYDELILFNDSFYGPLYPIEKIFAAMEKFTDADFWGITIHGQTEDFDKLCPYGYVPEHIQSYFLVVREKLFHSHEFLSYWKQAEVAKTFVEAIKKHEAVFTKYFFDLGFQYAAYCDTRSLDSNYDIKLNPYFFLTEKLLKQYNCPVVKKKIFLDPRAAHIIENYGDGPHKSLEFIKNHTNYDVSLIWKNLLRIQNVAELKSTLGLDYVLAENFCTADKPVNFKEVAIVAHLYYEDLMAECVQYLCNAPKEISILVTVDSLQKKLRVEKLFEAACRNCEVRVVNGRGRDLAALFVGCRDVFKNFKYLCFIHDKKSIRPGKSILAGEAFFHMLWENTLASENFIRNVLATFESEPNLGLLVPPHPHHSDYRFFILDYWTDGCFEQAVKLAERLHIPKKFLNRKISSLAIGSVFWCRTVALEKITAYEWRFEDFPAEPMPPDDTINHALERIFPFAAQAEGFYTGWLMTDSFVKDVLENYKHFYIESFGLPVSASLVSLKYFIKSRFPRKYWRFFAPFKYVLQKLGFNV